MMNSNVNLKLSEKGANKMADSFLTTLIKNLPEENQLSESAEIMIDTEMATKKSKLSTLTDFIKQKLRIGTAEKLSTTSKEIVGAINELNTKTIKTKFLEVSINTTANQDANITVDWGVGSGQTIVAHFIQKVVGSAMTTNILFCEFTSSTNIRIKSASSQKVTVGIVCLYR